MQRRINQETTSSQVEQTKSQKENQIAMNGIQDNKVIFFNEIRKENKNEKGGSKQQQAVKAQCHKRSKKQKQQQRKAPAQTMLGTKRSAAAVKPHPKTASRKRTRKGRHLLCYKRNTRSLNSSERLEEMHKELLDTSLGCNTHFRNMAPKQGDMGDTTRSHHG